MTHRSTLAMLAALLTGCQTPRPFHAEHTFWLDAPAGSTPGALTFDGQRYDGLTLDTVVAQLTPQDAGECADSMSFAFGSILPLGGLVEFVVFAPGWDPLPREGLALPVVGTDPGGARRTRLGPPDLVDVESWLSGGTAAVLGGPDVPGGLVIEGAEVCDAAACRPTDGPIVVELERPWIEPHVVETTNANGPSGVTDEDGLPLCN